MNRGQLRILLLGVGFFMIGFMVTYRRHDLPQGQLTLAASPSMADISIDGSRVGSGRRSIDVGTHVIQVSATGFTTYKTTVNVSQSRPKYIGAILKSSSGDTANWYTDHPSDQKLSEAINDRLSDTNSGEITTDYPFFSKLPVYFGDGHGGLIRIDSEAAILNSGKPSVGIYAAGPSQRQQAIEWFKSRGYSFSGIDVIFYGPNIPLLSGSRG